MVASCWCLLFHERFGMFFIGEYLHRNLNHIRNGREIFVVKHILAHSTQPAIASRAFVRPMACLHPHPSRMKVVSAHRIREGILEHKTLPRWIEGSWWPEHAGVSPLPSNRSYKAILLRNICRSARVPATLFFQCYQITPCLNPDNINDIFLPVQTNRGPWVPL